MNVSKQVKNMGMICAISATGMMSSTAVNAATLSFVGADAIIGGDQVVNPGDNFSLTLVAEGLLENSYGGGLGIIYNPNLVSITGATVDPIWNLSPLPEVNNAVGTLEFNVTWLSFTGSPVDMDGDGFQNIISIDFTASSTNTGNFDFEFYSLGAVGDWGYTPPLTVVGDGDLTYCMTMDSALPTTCMDSIPNANGRELLTLVSSNVLVPGSAVVPVPAAVWLFGSGLLGLLAVSRRKAA